MGLTRFSAGVLLRASVGVTPTVPWTAPLNLALLTGPADELVGGAGLPEATYPGYLRVPVQAVVWGAWDGVALTNVAAVPLAPVLAGDSILVVQAALCTDALAGDVVHLLDVVPFLLGVDDVAPQIGAGMMVLEL